MQTDLAQRFDFALDLAREAGSVTLAYFQTDRFSVERKGDGTPVTLADRDCERVIRTSIERKFPGDGILGEEFPEESGTSGFRWIVDPIDGTKSFIHGVPLYGTLIALEHGGESVLGVIRMPALDEMVYACRGTGAWHVRGRGEPRRAWVTRTGGLDGALVCTTGFEYFQRGGHETVLRKIANAGVVMRGWSDCYGHVLVATGRADAVVEPMLSPWDIAPMIPIMAEAGGRCTDWLGRSTHLSSTGLSSNGLIHDAMLALLNRDERGCKT